MQYFQTHHAKHFQMRHMQQLRANDHCSFLLQYRTLLDDTHCFTVESKQQLLLGKVQTNDFLQTHITHHFNRL
jgi:penicillin-binding protein-related factor A (putative recombinase)